MEYDLHKFVYDMLFAKDQDIRNGNRELLSQIAKTDKENLNSLLQEELNIMNKSANQYELIIRSNLIGLDVDENYADKISKMTISSDNG